MWIRHCDDCVKIQSEEAFFAGVYRVLAVAYSGEDAPGDELIDHV